MKHIRRLLTLSCWLVLTLACPAAQQTINLGATNNDGTGDPLRTAFGKANSNFTELYTAIGDRIVYLAATGGNDANSGARTAPLATLTAALTAVNNQGEIILLAGSYTNIKASLASAKHVYIHSEPGQRVRVYLGEKTTALTQDSGARYYATVAAGYSFTDRTNGGGADRLSWVFEENTPEGLIVDPRPQQSGRVYQLDHSRLWRKTSAANVTGNSEYFYDSGTNRLYFRASDGASPPGRSYWIPSQTTTQSFIYGGTAATDVTLEGIEVYFGYNGADLSGCGHAIVRNCIFFGNFNEGLLAYNFGSIEEFGNTFAANGNDGFGFGNSFSTTNAKVFSGDSWYLRNGDEGSSAHEYVTVTRLGGLYENNASSGITDALGAQFNIIEAYTRANGYDTTGPGTASGNGGIATGASPAVNGTVRNWTSDHDWLGIYVTSTGTQFVVTGATESGTTVTVTTSAAHGWKTGQTVTVAWTGGTSGYTGAWTLTGVPTSTTATYTAAGGLASPATLGTSPLAYENSVVTLNNPTVISPDATKWAFGSATGVTLNVNGYRAAGVTNLTAGAGANFNQAANATSEVIDYTPTSGSALQINATLAANAEIFKLHTPATDFTIGLDGSAAHRLVSNTTLILSGPDVNMITGGAFRFYFQANGNLRLASQTIPATSGAAGTAGEMCWDASYIYVCTAANTWKRVALNLTSW